MSSAESRAKSASVEAIQTSRHLLQELLRAAVRGRQHPKLVEAVEKSYRRTALVLRQRREGILLVQTLHELGNFAFCRSDRDADTI